MLMLVAGRWIFLRGAIQRKHTFVNKPERFSRSSTIQRWIVSQWRSSSYCLVGFYAVEVYLLHFFWLLKSCSTIQGRNQHDVDSVLVQLQHVCCWFIFCFGCV